MCPPDVDQTMRSPQQYIILAPECQQTFFFSATAENANGWGVNSNKAFDDGHGGFDAWDMLARPVPPHAPLMTTLATRSKGKFDIMSNEIVDMVFDYLIDNAKDIMALGLTCASFWHLVSKRIQLSYLQLAAPWAGTKLIFQGSYATELPESIRSYGPAEQKDDSEEEEDTWRHFSTPAARRLFWGHYQFKAPETISQKEKLWRDAALAHQNLAQLSESVWKGIEGQLSGAALFPRDRTWLLRNLTTKEFVSFVGKLLYEVKFEGYAHVIDLESVLLWKMLWDPTSSGAKNRHHQGDWAGHCFDMVTEEGWVRDQGDGWRDITAAIKEEFLTMMGKFEDAEGSD